MEAKAMGASNQAKSSNLFRIIWAALTILIKNWNALLIFTLLYSISFLLPVFQSISVAPILTNLLQNLKSLSKTKPPNPDFYQIISVILTEIREVTVIETVFFITIFFISTLLVTSTLCFISMTYIENKQPTLKELFCKLKKTWKGTMITNFYATIFGYMCVAFMFLLVCGFTLFSMNHAGLVVVSLIILTVAVILHLYLAMIWLLSLVVSVEDEEGMYGLAAIVKATEMIKGRRWKGILINIFIILLELAAFLPLMHLFLSEKKKMMVFGIFFVITAVVNVFDLALIVVFYFDCKKGDEGLAMMLVKNKCGFGYSSLPSEAPIDSEVP